MTNISRLDGDYYEPQSSKSHRVVLMQKGDRSAIIMVEDKAPREIYAKALSGLDTILFANGASFRSDEPLPASVRKIFSSPIGRFIEWLEAFSWLRLALYVGLFIIVVFGFRIAVYGSSYVMAQLFPATWEEQIGQAYYFSLEKSVLDPSALSPDRQKALIEKAQDMARLAGFNPLPHFHIHDSSIFGANAMALPGGPIIITDDLIKLLDSDRQILGVVAHELGHVRKRHALQQTIKLAGTSLLLSFIFGSDDSLMEEFTSIGVNSMMFSSSRDNEREADLEAIDILVAAKRAPEDFLDAMQALTLYQCEQTKDDQALEACMKEQTSNWASTHPSGAERMTYLKEKINSLRP